MLYRPDLIMYLWLVPVFIIFFLPLLLIPAGMLYNRFLAARARLANEYSQPLADEQREHLRRGKIEGIVAHVSDGVNYCTCSVNDVSRQGISLVNPSESLDTNAERLGVLLTGRGKSFQMQVKPKWRREGGSKPGVGAIIEDNTWNWEEFEQHIEGVQAAV